MVFVKDLYIDHFFIYDYRIIVKNSDIKSIKTIFLVIPMILSAVCSGMDIHQASAQMSGLVNFNCLFLCGIPGPQGPAENKVIKVQQVRMVLTDCKVHKA